MSANLGQVLFTNKMVGMNIKTEKNEKGWYRVKLGELNTYNSKGEYYLDTGMKELLSERNSYLSVANRLETGLLEGEVTHPIREGHSDNDWVSRNMIIHGGFASHKFMEIEYVPTDRMDQGRQVIEIWAWIIPTANTHGDALRADLENPDVNVAFSIRCFTKEVFQNGMKCRVITKIITWDRIDIPGLKNAIKGGDRNAIIARQSIITKEAGLSDFILTDEMIDNAITTISNDTISTESAGLVEILKELKSKKDIFFSW